MPTIQEWLRMYASTRREVRVSAAHGLLDRANEASLDTLIDILENLSWEGLGAKTEKALLKGRDVDLVARMIALLVSTDGFVREERATSWEMPATTPQPPICYACSTIRK